MNQEEIDRLTRELRAARDAYYNLDPIMSDQEYDAKRQRLAELDPRHEEVTAVGAEPLRLSVWEKVEHEIPMGSLTKVNEEDELLRWIESTGASQFLITHKIDGSSLEVVYEDGSLVRCVTRGDGRVGEDVTSNAVQIPGLPESVAVRGKVVVRGEVVMLKRTFEELYSEKYANPRNTAAGKIRDKKGAGRDCRNLSFLAFTIMSDSAPLTEAMRFTALRDLGFEVPDWCVGEAGEIVAWHRATDAGRDGIPYEIDGTVVRMNDVPSQEALGELNMRPRGQMAWKFDPAMGVTRVLDVRWQNGPTGRITPVAVLEPVDVGGVTIANVSLHNLSMFRDLGLWEGCEVLVSRRNDVIPYIERNLSAEKA
jgi:DNA ligase (NAD+)